MINTIKILIGLRTAFLIPIILLLYSCQVYTPQAYNPVLTNKKGEVSLSMGTLISTSTLGANASLTGALTDRISAQGNISTTLSQLRKLNFNASYLLNPAQRFKTRVFLGNSTIKLNYSSSIGVRDADYIGWQGNLNIPYTAMQITNDDIGITKGFALKAGIILPTLEKTIDREAETTYENITQTNLLIEPSIFTSQRLGKRFLFNAALTKAFILPLSKNRESDQVEFPFMKFPMVNFGLSYDLVQHKDKGIKK